MILNFPLLHFALLSILHFAFALLLHFVSYYILCQKLSHLCYVTIIFCVNVYYILWRNRYDGVNY